MKLYDKYAKTTETIAIFSNFQWSSSLVPNVTELSIKSRIFQTNELFAVAPQILVSEVIKKVNQDLAPTKGRD